MPHNATQSDFLTTPHILRTDWTFFISASLKQTHKGENCSASFPLKSHYWNAVMQEYLVILAPLSTVI